MKNTLLKACLLSLVPTLYLSAGEVDVENVRIVAMGENSFRLDVTLRHADEGWDHYADRWDVLDQSGNVLGSRILAHPHVNEQPFTRSLTLQIPPQIKSVTIRANDSVHKLGGKEMKIDVPAL